MLKGIYTFLATPFDNGQVDATSLTALVEEQVAAGIHGLVLLSPFGEGPSLSLREKRQVISLVTRVVRNRCHVWVDCTAMDTRTAVESAKAAREFRATGVLVAPPPLVQPSQEGIAEHCIVVAEAARLPTAVWDLPDRTGVTLTPATAVRLVTHPAVTDFVVHPTNTGLIPKIKASGAAITIAGSDDGGPIGLLAGGAQAVLSLSAHVAPHQWMALWDAWLEQDIPGALKRQNLLSTLHDALMAEPPVATCKAALFLLGRCAPELRLPLMWPLRTTLYRIAATLQMCGLTVMEGSLT